jgi:hypothetical protein
MSDAVRILLAGIFYLFSSIVMLQDIRRRSFPVWIGWAFFGVALLYAAYFGAWNRVIILLAVIIGFRLRALGAWTTAIIAWIIFLLGWQEDIWFVVLNLGIYFLFLLGWLGACDAEIAFPLIAMTGDKFIAAYLLSCWVLVPPIVVFGKRGFREGLHRFSEVAIRLFIRSESPLQDQDALHLPWTIYPFIALTVYLFIYPGSFFQWWRHLFQIIQ